MIKKKSTARTRTEMIAILTIVVAITLVVITLPRMSRNSSTAKAMACNTNISLMTTQLEAYYSEKEDWPAKFQNFINDSNYFPNGPPVCEAGGKYSIDKTTHRIFCSVHRQKSKD